MKLQLIARPLLQAASRSPVGMRFMMAMMKDETLLDRVTLDVSNNRVRRTTFVQALADAPPSIDGFEDLVWLYSSNRMNLGLSKLRLDEAAYLFRLVKSLPSPRVAEIGRYKGGTTLLLAAAGARVVSIDNDEDEQREKQATGPMRAVAGGSGAASLPMALAGALRHFGLDDRVELVTADSTANPTPPESFDLVFYDARQDLEGVLEDFHHWWPGVAAGGVLILRDGREPVAPGVMRACHALRDQGDIEVLDDLPGAFVGFRKPG